MSLAVRCTMQTCIYVLVKIMLELFKLSHLKIVELKRVLRTSLTDSSPECLRINRYFEANL